MKKYIIGVDEVGRGALAGPVVVCAALLTKGKKINTQKLGKLKDSKQLSRKKREEWVDYLKKIGVAHVCARVNVKVIDRINISNAANRAAWNAVSLLIKRQNIKVGEYSVFLDGSLYLKNKEFSIGRAKTVIRGDQLIKAISVASILAKVHRDRYMTGLSKKLPGYGMAGHKGYGTKQHIDTLKSLGESNAHRKTFTNGIISRDRHDK